MAPLALRSQAALVAPRPATGSHCLRSAPHRHCLWRQCPPLPPVPPSTPSAYRESSVGEPTTPAEPCAVGPRLERPRPSPSFAVRYRTFLLLPQQDSSLAAPSDASDAAPSDAAPSDARRSVVSSSYTSTLAATPRVAAVPPPVPPAAAVLRLPLAPSSAPSRLAASLLRPSAGLLSCPVHRHAPLASCRQSG